MHILVLAETNLETDTRMKRHLRALLEMGQQVTALLLSDSDSAAGLDAEGLRVLHWRCPEITLRADVVQPLAARLGLTQFLLQAFPGALAPRAFAQLGKLCERIQAHQLDDARWQELHQSVCKEGVEPREDYEGLCRSFEVMLLWADFACQQPADCVYCVDLPTLLAGVAHKQKYGSRLLFDAHEIYCDMAPGAQTRLFKQAFALLEGQLARHADCVFGVSELHAEWMRHTYELPAERVRCVPNCFALGQTVGPPPLRRPANPLRLYYHGNGDPFRGLDTITRAVARVPGIHLVLRCPPSPTMEEVRQLAGDLGMMERFKVLPLVPPDQMIAAIRAEADVGIHITLDRPLSLTLKVALTNKFIEYLVAGIPVLTAPLEEQARLVREHDIGFVLPGNSVEAVRCGLLWMLENRERLPEMGQRAHQVGAARFSWQNIRRTLVQAVLGEGLGVGMPAGEGDAPPADEAAFWSALTQEACLRCAELQAVNDGLDRQIEGLNERFEGLSERFHSPRSVGKQLVKLLARRLLRVPWRVLPDRMRTRLRPAAQRLLSR
jgi:glycosyltransferase involved in cell wall biosynthesis